MARNDLGKAIPFSPPCRLRLHRSTRKRIYWAFGKLDERVAENDSSEGLPASVGQMEKGAGMVELEVALHAQDVGRPKGCLRGCGQPQVALGLGTVPGWFQDGSANPIRLMRPSRRKYRCRRKPTVDIKCATARVGTRQARARVSSATN